MKQKFGGQRLVSLFLSVMFLSAIARAELQVEVIVEDLPAPWGMDFLPSGELLITMKGGRLLRTDARGSAMRWIEGLPDSRVQGQGGLLDVAAHPGFAENQLVYLTYTRKVSGGYTTALAQGKLEQGRLTGTKTLFTSNAVGGGGRHFGSRLAFDHEGYLFMTIGDRGEREKAQDLSLHNGKLLRFAADGSVPEDNPFQGRDGARPEIYSYGHRNPQGLAFDPAANRLWLHEHGPRGGDELNLIRAGANYGWPKVTYGIEYSGFPITDKREMPGIESPVYYWDPSIAPSGMAVYRGELFPQWQGDMLIGALKYQLLARVAMSGTIAQEEHRYLADRGSRIRDVAVGPDGAVYLLTDGSGGQLWRVTPG